MRLFVALDIDEALCQHIARFVDGVQSCAPDARWVRTESLHITLKFIGHVPDEDRVRFEQALNAISAPAFDLSICGHGFFPTPRSPRVFWLGIQAPPELALLAAEIDAATAALGIPKEAHAFSPHLTLARGAAGSGWPRWRKGDKPNSQFAKLQTKLETLPAPDFGTMTPREFFLYESKLSPKGSQYSKLAAFPLRSGT
jgi:RNA 2',3'-cyclic 3'-phosphodiesterase